MKSKKMKQEFEMLHDLNNKAKEFFVSLDNIENETIELLKKSFGEFSKEKQKDILSPPPYLPEGYSMGAISIKDIDENYGEAVLEVRGIYESASYVNYFVVCL
ncbi:MAG: hypothetical protein ACTSXG_00210 [Alphaproteobacteria bacterium]